MEFVGGLHTLLLLAHCALQLASRTNIQHQYIRKTHTDWIALVVPCIWQVEPKVGIVIHEKYMFASQILFRQWESHSFVSSLVCLGPAYDTSSQF